MSVCKTKKAPEYLREARLNAGYVNRSTATLKIPYSPETIGRHERGDVFIEPEDVVQYARGYGCPEILFYYCRDCPVGRSIGRTSTDRPLPFATLRVKRMIYEAQAIASRLEEIAFDGVIDETERKDFNDALAFLRQLDETINDMLLLGMTGSIKKAASTGMENGSKGK